MKDVRKAYYNWLVSLIHVYREPYSEYSTLLKKLYSTDFVWTIAMDNNRARDGVSLRTEFANSIASGYIPELEGPCSVLEMMIALARRIEIDIMGDPSNEYRPEQWFWIMIHNLGLDSMANDEYDEHYTDFILYNLLSRGYRSDGRGGLFWVEDCEIDLRDMEIWYQMHQYLLKYHPD